MSKLAWIALGGAAGTVCRYLVSAWLLAALGAAFPYGTLAVNLLGSFLLGVLYGVGSTSDRIGSTLMLALSTGFMGGFTTFSTFSLDTLKLVQGGQLGVAAAYVGGTLVGGLVGVWLGYALASAGARA
jgi:CrcB protein